MPRKRRDELDLLTAAFMAGEGAKQAHIAQVLGLSQAVISRLLHEAEKEGYLHRELRFVHERITPQQHAQILEKVSRKELAERLARLTPPHARHRPPILRVFLSDSSEPGPAAFARQAAPYVRQLIARSQICGIAWGGMLWHLCNALRDLNLPAPWAAHDIRFVPLSGEPLGDEPLPFSSSILASEFDRIGNARKTPETSDSRPRPLYLGAIPAFVPKADTEEERKAFWKFLSLSESYAKIFGAHRDATAPPPSAEPPLAWRLDTILTSTGPKARALGFGKEGSILPKDVPGDLRNWIVGDIGGVCLPEANLRPTEEEQLLEVTNRWTGLTLEQLTACAQKARLADPVRGHPGVVVISSGEARVEIIEAVVRRGLVNHLIIDQPLAEALNRKLKAAEQTHGAPTV